MTCQLIYDNHNQYDF